MKQTTENRRTERNRNVYRTRSPSRTLIISGMRNDVTKADIKRHFEGCTKITIKQNYLPPYLKYDNNYYVLHCIEINIYLIVMHLLYIEQVGKQNIILKNLLNIIVLALVVALNLPRKNTIMNLVNIRMLEYGML
jgi:RNA recognition motif-containing protein